MTLGKVFLYHRFRERVGFLTHHAKPPLVASCLCGAGQKESKGLDWAIFLSTLLPPESGLYLPPWQKLSPELEETRGVAGPGEERPCEALV